MAFAMASVGHVNRSLPDSTFILGGRTYHRIGSMRPAPGHPHCFAQIYMLDSAEAADRRSAAVNDTDNVLRRPVLELLHNLLVRYNPWVQQFRVAAAAGTPVLEWHSDVEVSGMEIGAVVAECGKRSIMLHQLPSGPLNLYRIRIHCITLWRIRCCFHVGQQGGIKTCNVGIPFEVAVAE